ncbi:hypothetical protein FKM82_009637 [Ascaphus truei]
MLCAQLNGDILKPQFMEQLSYLKERSKSLGEKEKCERLAGCLLLSTKLSSNIKHPKSTDLKPQRPQTAMATLGFQVKYAIDAPSDWKNKIPHPLDTESRFNYQIQPQVPELMNFTNKYGCYSNLHLPAKGTVPSVTYAHIKNQENIRQLTTYQRHFGKDYLDLSAVVSSLDPEELKNYLKSVANKGEHTMLPYASQPASGDVSP